MHPGSKYLKRTAVPTCYNVSAALQTDTPGPSSEYSAPDKIPSPKVLTPKKTYVKHKSISPTTSEILPTESDLSPSTRHFLQNVTDLPTPELKGKKVKRKLVYSGDVSEGLITPKRRKISELQKTIARHGILLKRKRTQISRLKSKLENKIFITDILHTLPYPSQHSKTLVTMQLLHKKKAVWSQDEKEFAIALYYKSPTAYTFLRRKNVILPAVSTIKTWISVSKCLPGFSAELFKQIKVKSSTMSGMEQTCVVCIDEMAIKESLEYSPLLDLIEGYEDLGLSIGRSNKTAKKALVFMARGLYFKWKLPLGYFLSNKGVDGPNLAILIKKCIDKLAAASLKPLAIVCDQGTPNVSAIKILGSTTEKPYFLYNSHKIYTIFDTPHLIKSIRNNLLNGYFQYENKTVRFQDIIDTYNIDKGSISARMLTKITDAHISPNAFEKMNCKLALQIFSNTMAAALRTCSSTGQLKSNSALTTADFVEMLDKTFDCLNSQYRFSRNPYSCAMSSKTPIVAETLKNAKYVMEIIQKVNFNSGKTSRPPCFDGLITTINAILSLHEEQASNGFDYLLTYRLNQDILENFFSVIRQRGGYSRNPTARIFRSSFRIAAIRNLMQPPESANCEQDDDQYLQVQSVTNTSLPESSAENIDKQTDSVSGSESSSSYEIQQPEASFGLIHNTAEDCAAAYFIGYLCFRCIKKFKCADCEEYLIKSDSKLTEPNELFILNKLYTTTNFSDSSIALRCPQDNVVEILTQALSIFADAFQTYSYKRKVLHKIYKKIVARIDPTFLAMDSRCLQHRQFIINLLIKVKIFKECKWCLPVNRRFADQAKPHQKLKILKNL